MALVAIGSWISHIGLFYIGGSILCLAFVLIGVAIGLFIARRNEAAKQLEEQRHVPQLRLVDTRISYFARLTYPLKCHVILQNVASEAADVRLIEFRPKDITLKRFLLEVLQIGFGQRWFPPEEVAEVAVYSNQLLSAWIGVDETKFTELQVNQAKGRIGTLIFSVNNQNIAIDL